MDTVPPAWQDTLVLAIAFVVATYFSVVKIILFSLDKNSLSAGRDRLRYYASKIEKLDQNRPLVDAVVMFGRILSTALFAVFAYRVFGQMYPGAPGYLAAIAPLAFTVLAIGFLAHYLPRALSKRYHESFVPLAYIAYAPVSWLFYPVVAIMLLVYNATLRLVRYDQKLAFLSSEDQSRMKKENGDDEVGLDEEEKEMIRSIFEFGDTTVEEIMVPRIDIKAFDVDTSLQSVLKMAREDGHSRLPVYRDTIDSIAGILYVKDVLAWLSDHSPDTWQIESLVKKAHFVPTGKKIDDLLADFKKMRLHIAVVVDEYGGTAGIATMEDILEEIVGEIQDEYDDEEKPIVKVAQNVYHVDPHMDLHDLEEELDVTFDLEDIEYNTLSGLIYHEHGDVPERGTIVEHAGLKIRVLEMDNQRIQKVEVIVLGLLPPSEMAF